MSGTRTQMDLFTVYDTPRQIKAALAQALKKSRMSRYQITEAVNARLRALGYPGNISPASLDKWTAPTAASHNIPAHVLGIVCQVLDDPVPLKPLCLPLGMELIGEKERAYMDLGRAERDARRVVRQRRRAQAALDRLED